MSANRLAIPAMGAAGVIGTIVYYRSSGEQKSRSQQNRERADAKREQGLGGAGVGLNANTGGHELGQPGSGMQSPSEDPSRAPQTDAPKEKLPPPGLGGGNAKGGTNARTIQLEGSGPDQTAGSDSTAQSNMASTSRDSSNPNSGTKPGSQSASESLHGFAGSGGRNTLAKGETNKMFDPKIHSNHTETPTKRA